MTTTDPPPLPDDCYEVRARPLPTSDDLATYLSIRPPIDADLTTQLQDCCDDAAAYELSRLSCALMVADGSAPPNTVPSPVWRAMLMYAAALWRRRNSINGFDGYDDLGTIPIRGTDPDIERQLDRWRAWVFA